MGVFSNEYCMHQDVKQKEMLESENILLTFNFTNYEKQH